jgi:hypothetical protein
VGVENEDKPSKVELHQHPYDDEKLARKTRRLTSTLPRKKMAESRIFCEGKSSKVELHKHPYYDESWQEIKED